MHTVCLLCTLLQDGQEFLKLLLSKLEVVFGASQRQVGGVGHCVLTLPLLLR